MTNPPRADAGGPALHDRTLLGTDALFLLAAVVGLRRTALPAAEAVSGHRPRGSHVDADHAHLHPAAELACHVTVADGAVSVTHALLHAPHEFHQSRT